MTESTLNNDQAQDARAALAAFQKASGLNAPAHTIKERPDGSYLVFYVTQPNERLFHAVNQVAAELPDDNEFRGRATLKKRPGAPRERLQLPEARHLRTVLSESLTVSRHSFEEDFFSRYIRSVFGAEDQIVAEGNHVVYGRRGAGKSSLLAYRLHQLRGERQPHAWVAMQTYQGQSDHSVIPQVFIDILSELDSHTANPTPVSAMIAELEKIADLHDGILPALERQIPRIRRIIGAIAAERDSSITLFLDDIHVVSSSLQPLLLAKIYAVSRGNRTFLKLSGIEQFTRLWDSSNRTGLQETHDVQAIPLDYNLTMPKKSMEHIVSILDAHARYCGLPNVGYLCGERVLERLVLAAAGVPRDALNIFAQAMSRATVRDDKRVSITSVNGAVSEMAEGKIRDIQRDAAADFDEVNEALEKVKTYCINEIRKNAFLVEIQNDNREFQAIEKLIALRLLHVLHEGITPHSASRRYKALMLDFGFYVGIRAAKSVELFQKEPRELPAKDLRGLPKFPLQSPTTTK